MNCSHPTEASVLSVPASAQHSQASFSKTDTYVLKGLAVCMLLLHHLYMGVLPAPISIFENFPSLFATLSKVCVAVFTLISGYGLSISYIKTGGSYFKFIGRRLARLMKRFWLIYLLFFVGSVFIARPGYTPSEVYGNGISGAVQALIEFMSLRPLFQTASLNQTWWYMEAALVLYLFFPILFRFTEKAPFFALPITSIPLILYFIYGNNTWDTCREIYWFFPFVVGIFIAQRDLLSAFCRVLEKKRLFISLTSFALLLIMAVCRAKIGLAFDTFFALSILLFSRAVISPVPYVRGACAFIGKHSSDIFMTHSFFYCYFISNKLFIKFLWSPKPLICLSAFPLLLVISLLCSLFLDAIRKGLKMIP